MTWSNLTQSIVSVASGVMMVLFALEVTVRTALITWQEIRKAWRSLREKED